MPATVKQFKSWSNSRLADYRQCPLKAKLQHLDKMPQPKNTAMERGGKIHDLASDFLTGKIARLPKDLELQREVFEELRQRIKKDPAGTVVEQQWGFTADWGRADWFDWARCVARIKLDVATRVGDEVSVLDWKTGKYRDDNKADYLMQLELYALATLIVFAAIGPNLTVRARLIYLDVDVIHPEFGADDDVIYTPKDVPRLKKAWAARVKPMMNDKTFAPRPNKFCYSCHFRKDNGGPCKL